MEPFWLLPGRRVKARAVYGLATVEIEDLVDALSIQAEIIEPLVVTDPALRDVHDRPVLGTLLAAQQHAGVQYLVTGDKDLLALSPRYPVLAPAGLWALHGGA